MKKIVLSLAVIAVVAVVAVGVTRAYFSDTETSTGNTFSTGTLNIEFDPNGIVNNTNPPTLPVSLSGLVPGYNGETEGDYYYPAVANIGSMNFNWKFSLLETASTSPMGGDLNDVLKVKIEESEENGGSWAYPAGGSFNCQNDVIWPPITYPNTTVSTVYEGSVAAYSTAVDMGELEVGRGRCYRMSFYLDSDLGGSGVDDNLYQGASAVYTIGVEAEQIP